MGRFEDFLVEKHNSAYLIDDNTQEDMGGQGKSRGEYIKDAEPGLIVAFRLLFEAKNKAKLSKVISGKILENNPEKEKYIVETRNGLKYGVPYAAVVWIKTTSRWPAGVYEEMKQGPREIETLDSEDLGKLSDKDFNYED